MRSILLCILLASACSSGQEPTTSADGGVTADSGLAADAGLAADSGSAPDARPPANQRPVAQIAAPSSAPLRVAVSLDGSGSYDPEGETLTFAWSLAAPVGSSAVLDTTDSATSSFTPDLPGVYRVTLVVDDGVLASYAVNATVTVQNQAPVVDAGPDQVVDVEELVTLTGIATDADGDSLTFAWEVVDAPPGASLSLSDLTSLTTTFTPEYSGAYRLRLTAYDGTTMASDEVLVAATEDMTPLPYRVVDAEYARATDRLIMISSSPAALHIYDPTTDTDIAVALPLAPTAVGVAPSGARAAVGHDGWISVVDLDNGVLEKTIPVSTDVIDIVLTDADYAYCFPRRDQWERIRTIDLATDNETLHAGVSIRAGTLVRLHPSQEAIYGADNGLSPSDIEKYDITGGNASYLYDSPYHGTYPMCGNLWISDDGLRIFTRCGYVFRSSTLQSEDMTYNGSLSELSIIGALDHSSAAGVVAAVPGNGYMSNLEDTELQFYDYDFLAYTGSHQVPQFYLNQRFFTGHGKYVFWNSQGTEYILLAQADASSGALYDFAIVRRPAP